MIRCIVGLGNPGKQYEDTRHNIGWQVLDCAAQEAGAQAWRSEEKFEGQVAEVTMQDDKCWLLKPTTFMNNSGRSVAQLCHFYRIQPEEILVVHDELALPFGTLRLRQGGQSAGNHGVESVAHHLGIETFWRLRCGIDSSSPARADATRFVLSPFNETEQQQLPTVIDRAAQLVLQSLTSPLEEVTISLPSGTEA